MRASRMFAMCLLVSVATTCPADTIVVNDVYLSSEYFGTPEEMFKEFRFGQFETYLTRDFDFVTLPFGVAMRFSEVEFGTALDQSYFWKIGPINLETDEQTYIGFATRQLLEEPGVTPWETFGWMLMGRSNEGELLLLESATSWGDPEEGRLFGPATGITVGQVPEPSAQTMLLMAACALGCLWRQRSRVDAG